MVLGFDPAFVQGLSWPWLTKLGSSLQRKLSIQWLQPVRPKIAQAKKDLADLIKKHDIEIIAIGNGTASRESEAFVAEVLKGFSRDFYVIVNESGALSTLHQSWPAMSSQT